MWKNTSECFGWITISLHWLMALLMVGLFLLGGYMVDLSYTDRYYNLSYTVHKSLGILTFEVVLLQIFWRLYAKHSGPLGDHKPWEILAANIAHIMLFSMMVLIPLSGYAISSAKGQAVAFFDLYAIPAVFSGHQGMEDLAGMIHFYLAYATAGLVVLHIVAALKHQLIDKDNTLFRMLGICSKGQE